MKNYKVMKAEILITRKCNLSCSYCNMPVKDIAEIPPNSWLDIVKKLKETLDCSFYAIYGAEPLLYFGIFDFIKGLNNIDGVAYSLLTNTIEMNHPIRGNEIKKKLLDAGLKSITFSMDGIDDIVHGGKSINLRNNSSYKTLQWALENRLDDIQVTSTIHRKNIGQKIYELIKYLTEKNIWYSFDFIHDNKGVLPYTSKCMGKDNDLAFQEKDIPKIEEFLSTLIEMKKQGAKIYQSEEWLNWLTGPMVIYRHWRCDSYPAWLTIDADGYMVICDDYLLKSDIYAFDLPKRFNEFIDFRRQNLYGLQQCRDCIWSTHWESYRQFYSSDGKQHVTHKRIK